jgi:GDP-L-fucose synthase
MIFSDLKILTAEKVLEMDFFNFSGKKIWVAGHTGMVGAALLRRLKSENCEILCVDRQTLDLTCQNDVSRWIDENRPDGIFLAAARVGGIHANQSYPADFIYDNMAIALNVVKASVKVGVEKLMFFGSSCIYPRDSNQPISETSLLTGSLEPTNMSYAVAKIACIILCKACRQQYGSDFISVMPTNLYGPGDNFHPENSHVPAALLSRFCEAYEKNLDSVTVWGTGTPLREFMHVDDLADACVYVMKYYSDCDVINIGTGKDVSIAEFAGILAEITGFQGRTVFDTKKLLNEEERRLIP